MIVLSFLATYALMYAMVNTFGNVYSSLNQVYMAGLMTAAMLLIELSFMGGMYPNRRLNAMLLAAGAAALHLFWMATRRQAAVSGDQFLLMCQGARIEDPGIAELCQQSEIDWMKAKLGELDR
jgi:hypothetical protein